MTHDPLCSVQDDDPMPLQLLCICGELSAARRDMLARCIAALESLARTPYFCNEQWSGAPTHLDTGEVFAALRALQTP